LLASLEACPSYGKDICLRLGGEDLRGHNQKGGEYLRKVFIKDKIRNSGVARMFRQLLE
jgi:hypothetical protein